MKISRRQLRSIISEVLLKEAYVTHDVVKQKIKKNIDEFMKIDIDGFEELMQEIAVVETGTMVDGVVNHNNEMSGQIRGVFQLSPIALKQLRKSTTIPATKAKFDASTATKDPWDKQTNADVFSTVGMQTAAAVMYAMWAYINLAGSPDLSSVDARAKFWANHYNTTADPLGTAQLYKDRVKLFLNRE